MSIKKAPSTLGQSGKKLWRDLQVEYDITDAASLAILQSLCETVDRLAECRKTIKADGLTVPGSGGQPRPHPLLQTEAEARRALLAHSRALRLDLSGEY
ncbi:MAG TPA: P27 family phage terminase small subunit [Castellaniella sp.]|jgi:P27 family predicted phage terminase small subunit|nr:P27 family phage terminase small subunit [Castellaniella sp.]